MHLKTSKLLFFEEMSMMMSNMIESDYSSQAIIISHMNNKQPDAAGFSNVNILRLIFA